MLIDLIDISDIDKESPIPIYYQIKERMRALIEAGDLKPGMQVPSERELCDEYGVSRMTVRQAISELVKEGVLYRLRGKGTFVAEPKLDQPIMQLSSFSEDMHKRGMQAGAKTVDIKAVHEDISHVRRALRLEDEEPALKIERLRFADGVPMVFEVSYFSYRRFYALEKADLEHCSLYNILEQQFGAHPVSAKETLEAALADSYIASMLGIEEGAPVIMVIGVTYDEDDVPIEYVRSYYRGDRYKFYLELKR
ncbi:GntR family transcriptional regulator [Mahella australiensis]|uniref:Transcriptional regulator, GntR family n=1 Tax=Mahella australiensis (strain DSM 15567 / CIP 107919 / 50-1 BON) TaxID=697281 RepID=F4A2G4_MAHA5|nr:GntR family transcriptional regulator [Mahella australiensis]AEE97230.1 transcriptional regulator, GntR family [Mahella australiensis 50-1 BON]